MKHFGDITKLSGYTLPPVDVITGGSPCQDLSVAGKRAGLDGERSGLFMEQIRIVKEMRQRDRDEGRADEFLRPRYMVWENVPGAFSSNGGKDFQAVLTEIVRISEPEAPNVPLPDKGKWDKSGCIYDELGGWSIAWRVHDAQFWGVPQRRKRIALVADFGGLSTPEILFERKGLRRHSEPRGEARERTARSVEASTTATSYNIGSYHSNAWKSSNPNSGVYETDVSKTLDALNCGAPLCNQGETCVVERERERESCDRNYWRIYAGECGTSSDTSNEGLQRPTHCAEMCFEPRSPDGEPRIYERIAPTLNTAQGGQRTPCVISK